MSVPASARLLLALTAVLVLACGGPAGTPTTGAGSPTPTFPGGVATPTEGQSPDASPTGAESPDASPTDGQSPDASPTDGESPGASPTGGQSPGAVSGDLFAYGVTRTEGADEIATVRLDYFEEQYHEVNLSVSESNYSPEDFLTEMQSGDPPDVLRVDRTQIASLAARGLLQPLDQCFSQMGVDPSQTYFQGALEQVTWDGQIYAAPEFMNTVNWFINTNAFSEANLDPQSLDFSNWDAMRAANEQLLRTEGGQVTRLGIDPKITGDTGGFFPLWVKANGHDLISADGMTAQFDDPAVAEALQFAVDLVNAHGGRDPFIAGTQTFDPFGAENQFALDRTGAVPQENFFLNALLGSTSQSDAGELQWQISETETAPMNLAFQQFVARDGSPLTFATGPSLAVTSVTDNPDAACAWVVTMTGDEAWTRAAQERKRLRDESGQANTGTFAANRVAMERIFGEVMQVEDLPAPFDEAVQVFLDNMDNAFSLPASPGSAAIFGQNGVVAELVGRALDGEDINAVLADAQQQAQQAIDEAANR